MQVWKDIQSDKDYDLVKGKWEEKTKDPSFVMDIQAGTKNVAVEFQETVREYYKDMIRKSKDTIEKLQGGAAPAAPHVEGDAQISHTLPTDKTPQQATVDNAKEAVEKGHVPNENEELSLLDAVLGGQEE